MYFVAANDVIFITCAYFVISIILFASSVNITQVVDRREVIFSKLSYYISREFAIRARDLADSHLYSHTHSI